MNRLRKHPMKAESGTLKEKVKMDGELWSSPLPKEFKQTCPGRSVKGSRISKQMLTGCHETGDTCLSLLTRRCRRQTGFARRSRFFESIEEKPQGRES